MGGAGSGGRDGKRGLLLGKDREHRLCPVSPMLFSRPRACSCVSAGLTPVGLLPLRRVPAPQINASSLSPLGYHFPWHNEVTAETTDSFAAILAKRT